MNDTELYSQEGSYLTFKVFKNTEGEGIIVTSYFSHGSGSVSSLFETEAQIRKEYEQTPISFLYHWKVDQLVGYFKQSQIK